MIVRARVEPLLSVPRRAARDVVVDAATHPDAVAEIAAQLEAGGEGRVLPGRGCGESVKPAALTS
jgi:hypothetical protein